MSLCHSPNSDRATNARHAHAHVHANVRARDGHDRVDVRAHARVRGHVYAHARVRGHVYVHARARDGHDHVHGRVRDHVRRTSTLETTPQPRLRK
jgi:hypothetical protein